MRHLRTEEIDEDERDSLRRRFETARPFPHVVLDGQLAASPEEIVSVFPSPEWDGWQRYGDEYQKGKMICRDIEVIPDPFRSIIEEASAPSFLQFLEHVTGIGKLLVDPYLEGGGLHASGAGGILAPHTDFHVYTRLQLYRRINVLIYLNPEWEQQWGGCLELFADQKATVPVLTVVPTLGRIVIFQTDDRSVHGFTKPIDAGGRYRRSIALYYYTSEEAGTFSGDTNTYWKQHGEQSGRQRLRLGAYRGLLFGSRALSWMAHRVNPNLGSRLKPK